MNHINIQNESTNITEYVDSNILEKIYNLFSGEVTPTELDHIILDNTSILKGHLTVQVIFKFIYDWLLERYPNTLRINYNDLYIYIKDPYIEAKLLENNFGDITNSHVTYSKAFAATTLPIFGITNSYNEYEENITEFKELAEFTNVKKLPNQIFRQCRNLETVDLVNITELEATAFYRSGIKHCLNSGNVEIIGAQCFENSQLETFDFSSVKSIGNLCMQGTKLNEVHFNGSEDLVLGSQSFRSCTNLTVIDGLENIKDIPNDTFAGCSALLELRLNNCESIGIRSFVDCTSLHTFYAPKLNTKIDENSFNNCQSLTNLTINWENITTIKSTAFQNCKLLESDDIDISHVMSFIGTSHFNGCTSLTSLTLNLGIVAIPNQFVRGCNNLTSINNISNITIIDWGAFYGCTSLTSISFPNVTTINGSAFYGCTSLTSIDIPNCTHVNDHVFTNCNQLTTITGLSNFVGSSTDHATYKDCSNLLFPNQINITSEYVGYNTFKNCKEIKHVSLSSNTNSLYNSAFQNCINLTDITGLENIQYIGMYAFSGCLNLEGVINLSNLLGFVPNTRIDNDVQGEEIMLFNDCAKITKVIIGNIPYLRAAQHGGEFSPFKNCTLLHTLDIANIDDYIEFAHNQLFFNCPNIKNLVLRQNSVVECKITVSTLSITNIVPSTTTSTFKIYVPDELVNDYKTATNWANIQSYIRPLSEYVEITD